MSILDQAGGREEDLRVDAVKGRMQRVWITEDNSRDRMIWRQTICFGKP